MFKNILVPTDGSDLSQETARRAVSFAREAGATITAFHAKPEHSMPYYVEGVGVQSPTQSAYDEADEQQSQEILGYIEKLCHEAGIAFTKRSLTSNIVYEAIIEAATEGACDLIFMASHGRRGLSALLLGSETTKVLTHSKIPVLVYR